MHMRIDLAGTSKQDDSMVIEAMIGGIQLRVLARENQRRRKPARMKRVDDRGKLDGFGTSADNNGNMGWQPSP
jgi:hypothetical protein